MAHPAARLVLLPIAVACALPASGCDDVATQRLRLVRVAPEIDPACGAPAGARTLLVRAIGEFPPADAPARSLDVDDPVAALAGLPDRLAGLEIEVLDAGGVRLAIGRTAPFVLDDVADGAEVAVFTAPPRGACPTGPSLAARAAPLVAGFGAGAIVVGGRDGDGEPVHSIERYDPAHGVFVELAGETYGSGLAAGLAGASLTQLADGRVALVGGAATAYQVIDPIDDAIAAPAFLREARAFHAAVALADGRLFLAGGCAQLDGVACAPDTALRSTSILDVERGELVAGPALARERIGGVALRDGDGRVVVAGGVAPDGTPLTVAERIDPDGDIASEDIDATAGGAVRLASGATLTAFAPPDAPASGEVAVVPPGALAASALAAALPRAGTTLVALEDGGALAVGGAPLWYAPYRGLFVAGEAAELPLGAGAVRLPDGSVLVVGGEQDGEAAAAAWIVRPELTGPASGSAIATFGDDAAARLAVPRDPTRLAREEAAGGRAAHVVLETDEWLVVGGPRPARPQVTTRLIAEAGARVLIGFVDEANHHAVELIPGQPVRLTHTGPTGDAASVGCDGAVLAADALGGELDADASHEVGVTTQGADVLVVLDGQEILRCAAELDAGYVGVAAQGGALRVDLLGVSR